MKPKFSVLTPVFNGEAFLRRSYWCLLEQSCESWEWIVVDDGSTDGTAEVVEGFRDARIKLMRLKKNFGRGYARTKGLEVAVGDWVVVWDVDDVYFPDRLSVAEEALHGGFDFCVSNILLINGQIDVVGTRGFGLAEDGVTRLFPHPTLACKRDVLRDIGYEAGDVAGEDFYVIYMLSRTFKGHWRDGPVVAYREDANQNKLETAIGSKKSRIKAYERLSAGHLGGNVARIAKWKVKLKLWMLYVFRLCPPLYRLTFRYRDRGEKAPDSAISGGSLGFLKVAREKERNGSW